MSRTQQKTNVAISVITALAIALMVNYLASRNYVRADWTSSGMHTLSEKTIAQVSRVTGELKIYVLWSKSDPLHGYLTELLKRYQSLSEKISVEAIDPDSNPEQFALISQKYSRLPTDEYGQANLETGVIVVNGSEARFVPSSDFQDYSDDMTDPSGEMPLSTFKAEQEITSAIAGVLDKTKRTICFTQGHGEWSFDGDPGASLTLLRKALRMDGFDSSALEIDNGTVIPKSCNLVAAVGPSRAFLEDEARVLDVWLKGGKPLLLLLDPVLKNDSFVPSGLEKLTFDAGISLNNDMAVETDPRQLHSQTPLAFTAAQFFKHAAVKPLSTTGPLPVFFSSVRSLKVVESSGAIAEILTQTSKMSWGETNAASILAGVSEQQQDLHDNEGPLTIAIASTLRGNNPSLAGKLIVVGDSDFLIDELRLDSRLYNQDFFNSMIGWLTEYKSIIAIAPKDPEQLSLRLTESDSKNILLTLAFQIILIIGLGIITIMGRRK